MKNLMTIIFAGLLIFLPISGSAAGAISADEQKILDALNQGVTTKEGQTFYFDATDIQQAENELKINDFDAAACTTVVEHINAARQLVIDNSAGIQATSLKHLLGQLPVNIQNQIRDHILAAAQVLGLSIDGNGNIVDNKGQKVIVPTTTTNPVVKTTGVSSTISIATLISLVSLTAVTGFMTRKKGINC